MDGDLIGISEGCISLETVEEVEIDNSKRSPKLHIPQDLSTPLWRYIMVNSFCVTIYLWLDFEILSCLEKACDLDRFGLYCKRRNTLFLTTKFRAMVLSEREYLTMAGFVMY